MDKINIVGNMFGSDGYSSHVRQLANALHEGGFEVRIDCNKPQAWQRYVNDAELLMLNREFDEDMTSILVGQPQFLPYVWAENPKKTIMFLIWEGDSCPLYWLDNLLDERTDQIWVPSEHVKEAILHTKVGNEKQGYIEVGSILEILEEKIKIIPHGVDQSIFYPKDIKKEKFTFLCNKGWRGGMEDRGGVQYLLKAYTEEFTKKDNVELIVKLNPAYLPPNFDFKQELEKIGITKTETSPPILFNSELTTLNALNDLYNKSEIYVCTTRAEGFNLPGLEAHAVGIPTLQTNYGGQTDYMSEESDYYLQEYTLENVKDDICYEGIKWATPDIKEIRKQLRYCYEHQDEVRRKGQSAVRKINGWSWRSSVQKIKEALKNE